VATYQRPRSTRLLVLALLVTSLVTITVDFRAGERGPLAAIGRIGASVVTPLQEAVTAVVRPVANFIGTLFRAGSLQEENAGLRQQIEEFTATQPYIQSVLRENERLRELLELEERLGFDLFGATVTGGSVSNFEWAVWVDKGSEDGVFVEQPVITGSGAVGQVVKVLPSQAKVVLIIDPESRIAVRLASSGETGVLVGQQEEDLLVELIPPDTEVSPGEPVVTSTYGPGLSIFPPEVPVGVVSRVVQDQAGLQLGVLVSPAVDFSSLEFVALVRPEASAPEDREPPV
jgi:rod shape-determining protein MreC